VYASAQPLDFLARTKKSSSPNWKPIVSHPEFPDGQQLTAAVIMALRMVAIKSAVDHHCIRAAVRGFHLAIVQISIKKPLVLC
jgi:hypothetical protein